MLALTSRMISHLQAGDMDVNVYIIPAQSFATLRQIKSISVYKLLR